VILFLFLFLCVDSSKAWNFEGKKWLTLSFKTYCRHVLQFLTFSTTSTLNEKIAITMNTTWSPTFNSLVVLKYFHPFPMLIMGDPIFLPLVTHTFMCLIFLCLPRIVTSMPILPPSFIRNC
jgi:hypothetical protein